MEQEQDYDPEGNSKVHYLNFGKKNTQKSDQKLDQRLNASVASKKDSENKQSYNTVCQEILKIKPAIPTYCIRPNSIKRAASWFLSNFKSSRFASDVLYSVKSNPDVAVLEYLHDAGVKHFDVASFPEIKLVNELFGDSAKMYFMHPIKSREAIHEAYFNYGIRDFSLDSFDELEKILEVTNDAKDLGLHVRLAIPNSHAVIDLSGKFGILPSEATSLVRKTRSVAKRFGICFHVGSQCMEPTQYRNAMMITKEVLEQAHVEIDVLDIGGGFPSSYPGMIPLDMRSYFDEIFDAINQMGLNRKCQLWCEPGRALVAESGSLVVRVEGRKQNMLYINDGTYGGLFDAGVPGFIYPTKVIRDENKPEFSANLEPFGFYGPTCDSLDEMKGPFYLPEDIAEGDYIEIGQLGAYSRSIRTEFNGFNYNLQIEVSDEPLVSMYKEKQSEKRKRPSRKSFVK
ncbi:MAG: type III PLP-dependent enzyme [Rickettsiales bacterium]|nr:type III PLP-dependent enzyme [Rickettsiales bacterium]